MRYLPLVVNYFIPLRKSNILYDEEVIAFSGKYWSERNLRHLGGRVEPLSSSLCNT